MKAAKIMIIVTASVATLLLGIFYLLNSEDGAKQPEFLREARGLVQSASHKIQKRLGDFLLDVQTKAARRKISNRMDSLGRSLLTFFTSPLTMTVLLLLVMMVVLGVGIWWSGAASILTHNNLEVLFGASEVEDPLSKRLSSPA